MKILVLADEPVERLWTEKARDLLDGIDLILSCGDLKASYLSFLTCFTQAPVVYVRGNHDKAYHTNPPEGCICAEDRIVYAAGLRILGLGGSMRYRPDSSDMYTENEMKSRVRALHHKLHSCGGFDILLTHAPVEGLGDQEDLAHRGFGCFASLLMKYRPAVMFHGHIHQSYTGSGFQRIRELNGIPVINACGSTVFEWPENYTPLKLPRSGALKTMKKCSTPDIFK